MKFGRIFGEYVASITVQTGTETAGGSPFQTTSQYCRRSGSLGRSNRLLSLTETSWGICAVILRHFDMKLKFILGETAHHESRVHVHEDALLRLYI
jgi:hypothetical protein